MEKINIKTRTVLSKIEDILLKTLQNIQEHRF